MGNTGESGGRYCTRCGVFVSSNGRFCSSCGAELNGRRTTDDLHSRIGNALRGRWLVVAVIAVFVFLIFGSILDSSAPAPFGNVEAESYTILDEEESLSGEAELKMVSVESQASSNYELKVMASDINAQSGNHEFDAVGIRDIYEGEIYALVMVFNTDTGAEALGYPASFAEGSNEGDNIRIVDPSEFGNYY